MVNSPTTNNKDPKHSDSSSPLKATMGSFANASLHDGGSDTMSLSSKPHRETPLSFYVTKSRAFDELERVFSGLDVPPEYDAYPDDSSTDTAPIVYTPGLSALSTPGHQGSAFTSFTVPQSVDSHANSIHRMKSNLKVNLPKADRRRPDGTSIRFNVDDCHNLSSTSLSLDGSSVMSPLGL